MRTSAAHDIAYKQNSIIINLVTASYSIVVELYARLRRH